MRSNVNEIMSAPLRRTLRTLGHNIQVARRRRRLSVAMMLERTGMSKATLQRVEAGEPTVAIGAYAQCLQVLGLAGGLAHLADAGTDEAGLLLEQEQLPKRVRGKKKQGDGL